MTKIMSAEEWVDKTYGTDLDPKDREIPYNDARRFGSSGYI